MLVARVAAGDRHAFTALMSRHLPVIESFALRTLGDRHGAQDVTQEVMLRLWQRASHFDAKRGRLSTWLHQIAYNLCMDGFRRGARESATGFAPEPAVEPAYDHDPSVHHALAALPENQRTALVLTYYQSLTNREVADIMGLSVRALESLLVRARKRLRRIMRDMP
jgi:RNA polymerase sigma-70 factor (ECF subfamily)